MSVYICTVHVDVIGIHVHIKPQFFLLRGEYQVNGSKNWFCFVDMILL